MFPNYDHRQWLISRADVANTWVVLAIFATAGLLSLL